MRLLYRIILLLICPNVVLAKELKVAVGLSLPPYVIQEQNAGKEFDLVARALSDAGYTMKPVYLPFGRVPVAIQSGEVDAAITVTENSGIKDVFFSDSHISYQNAVISLRKNNFKIDRIEDIQNHSIVAFQNAKEYLGAPFKKTVSANPRYFEYAQQVLQNMVLYSNRVDLVVADRNIFNYYNKEARDRGANVDQEVVYHMIFPPTDYKVAFREQEIRDAFNVALRVMHRDGSYNTIVSRY